MARCRERRGVPGFVAQNEYGRATRHACAIAGPAACHMRPEDHRVCVRALLRDRHHVEQRRAPCAKYRMHQLCKTEWRRSAELRPVNMPPGQCCMEPTRCAVDLRHPPPCPEPISGGDQTLRGRERTGFPGSRVHQSSDPTPPLTTPSAPDTPTGSAG